MQKHHAQKLDDAPLGQCRRKQAPIFGVIGDGPNEDRGKAPLFDAAAGVHLYPKWHQPTAVVMPTLCMTHWSQPPTNAQKGRESRTQTPRSPHQRRGCSRPSSALAQIRAETHAPPKERRSPMESKEPWDKYPGNNWSVLTAGDSQGSQCALGNLGTRINHAWFKSCATGSPRTTASHIWCRRRMPPSPLEAQHARGTPSGPGGERGARTTSSMKSATEEKEATGPSQACTDGRVVPEGWRTMPSD